VSIAALRRICALPTAASPPVRSRSTGRAYADDQLGVMDHLGIGRFMVMGFCIGGPFIFLSNGEEIRFWDWQRRC
jgi:pimeloyl-ACP methyl ester carboxylesterase